MSTPRHSIFKRQRFADSSYLLMLLVLQNTRVEMPPAAVKVICTNGGNAHNKVSDSKRCCIVASLNWDKLILQTFIVSSTALVEQLFHPEHNNSVKAFCICFNSDVHQGLQKTPSLN